MNPITNKYAVNDNLGLSDDFQMDYNKCGCVMSLDVDANYVVTGECDGNKIVCSRRHSINTALLWLC